MAAPLRTGATAPAPRRRPTAPDRQPPRTAPAPLRLVGPSRRVPPWRRPRFVLTVTAVAVAIALFGLVAAHVALAQDQVRLQRLEAQADDAQARYEGLRLEVAELEAPGRVVAVAQERLGMVPAPGVTYLSPAGAAADHSWNGSVEVDGETSADHATLGTAGTAWSDVKSRLGRRP